MSVDRLYVKVTVRYHITKYNLSEIRYEIAQLMSECFKLRVFKTLTTLISVFRIDS